MCSKYVSKKTDPFRHQSQLTVPPPIAADWLKSIQRVLSQLSEVIYFY
jgi:hypothetical protein